MTSSADKKIKLAESGTLNPNAEQVTDPLFKNHRFFDANDLLQVKYEMLRRVEKDGHSVTDTVRNFGFSRRHFYALHKQFSEEGLIGLIPEKRGPRGAHKLNEEIMGYMDAQLKDNSSLRSTELASMIQERFKIQAHPRSIERAIERKKKEVKP